MEQSRAYGQSRESEQVSCRAKGSQAGKYDWAHYYEERVRQTQEAYTHVEQMIAETKRETEGMKNTHLYRVLSFFDWLFHRTDYTEKYLENRANQLSQEGWMLETVQRQIDHPRVYEYEARKREVAEAFQEAAKVTHEWDAYELEDFRLQHGYYAWQLLQREQQSAEPEPAKHFRYLTIDREKLAERWEELRAQATEPEGDPGWDYLAVTTMHGLPAEGYERRLDAYFSAHPACGLLYADEDLLSPGVFDSPSILGHLEQPWFKPEWCPETLLSFLYFGNFIVFSREILGKLSPEGGQEGLPFAYELCLQASEEFRRQGDSGEEGTICHIPEVLFHMAHCEGEPYAATTPGADISCRAVRERAIRRSGLAARLEHAQEQRYYAIAYEISEGTLVSAVILSKDHPKVLEKCVSSFIERTEFPDYELIVVDNGSTEENRAAYEALSREYGFCYIYEPQEFNFSAMCNRGYREAKGDLILLLNDDTEILQKDWLRRMGGLALQPEAGCVGAKLLYAGTDLIQHAGVAMLKYGPSHKMVRYSDGENWYHGANRVSRGTMAVTAACLMFERKKMEAIGAAASGSFPMDESYKVAYNDVELCLRFANAGYHNIQCNDAVLYHYESLTRGVDAVSAEKWRRLTREKKRLLAQYPQYDGHDPYYSPNLTMQATEYDINYYDPWATVEALAKAVPLSPKEAQRSGISGSRIKMVVDEAMLQPVPFPGARDTYVVSGWAYIPDLEAPLAEKEVVLEHIGGSGDADTGKGADAPLEELLAVPTWHKRRPEVAAMKPDQKLLLCGFFTRIPAEGLALGEYRVGLRMKVDGAYTGVCWSEEILTVKDRSEWKLDE